MPDVVDRPLQVEATGPSHDGQVVLKDLSMTLPPVQVMAFRARWRGQEHGDGHDQRTGRAGSGTGPRLGGSLRVLASRRRLGVMLQHASVRPHVLVLLGYTLLFAGWAIRRLQTKG